MTRVIVLGGTGTIGRATVRALVAAGHDVIAVGRRDPAIPGATFHQASPGSLPLPQAGEGRGEGAIISCLASRTGSPADAWAIDHAAHLKALDAAQAAGIGHFVLLSAICVQKPRLEFQHAKLAFEAALIQSGLRYSIVRPTAYFKSLSGQVDRLRRGKPFLLFGDGAQTACKPIGDDDLARFLIGCLHDPARWNRTLPIGGPSPAITPRDIGAHLFALLGRPPRYRSVPPRLLRGIARVLDAVGQRDKAELARIGHYYATESMLVWDKAAGRYDADATPETGSETLFDFLARLVAANASVDRGAHKVF